MKVFISPISQCFVPPSPFYPGHLLPCRSLYLFMNQLGITVELPASLTQNPYEAPEESLRVISNYSSLERMYQKTSPRKIIPQVEMPKKDSFQIAGWQHSPSKESKSTHKKSRTKFKTFTENKATLNLTISSQRQQAASRIKRKSLEPKAEKLMLTTNFKIGPKQNYKPIVKAYETCTPLSFAEPLCQANSFRAKFRVLRSLHSQNLMRCRKGAGSFNPQSQLVAPLEYPIVQEEGLSRRGLKRKQEFFRRFKN